MEFKPQLPLVPQAVATFKRLGCMWPLAKPVGAGFHHLQLQSSEQCSLSRTPPGPQGPWFSGPAAGQRIEPGTAPPSPRQALLHDAQLLSYLSQSPPPWLSKVLWLSMVPLDLPLGFPRGAWKGPTSLHDSLAQLPQLALPHVPMAQPAPIPVGGIMGGGEGRGADHLSYRWDPYSSMHSPIHPTHNEGAPTSCQALGVHTGMAKYQNIAPMG